MMTRPENTSRSRSKPVAMGSIVDKVIDSLGLAHGCRGWQAVNDWPDIVGEFCAERSHAFRFQDGVLYVAVKDASWRQTMALEKTSILAAIHARPYGREIKDIRLVCQEKGS